MIITTFIFSSILILITILVTNKYKIFLDIPNERSSHSKVTPRIGGLPVGIIFIICSMILNLNPIVISLSIIILIVGIIDDFIEVSNKLKLIIIFLISMVLIYPGVENLYMIPIMLLIISSIIIGFNFIDGLNGSSTILAIITTVMFSILYLNTNDSNVDLTLSLLVILVSFLMFNIKGTIFLGDSGTMFIGFILAYFSLDLYEKGVLDIIQALFINGLYLLDLIVIVFYRVIILKKSPFKADKNHIHHIIKENYGKLTLPILAIIHSLIIFSILGPDKLIL